MINPSPIEALESMRDRALLARNRKYDELRGLREALGDAQSDYEKFSQEAKEFTKAIETLKANIPEDVPF